MGTALVFAVPDAVTAAAGLAGSQALLALRGLQVGRLRNPLSPSDFF
jgi:hypothetical protein